jgi:GNAT superfamily N-acetyltransferase
MAMQDTAQIIKEIISTTLLSKSAGVIRGSFKTVASDFGLTERICPTHPSFITTGQLNELKGKGVKFFGLFLGERQIGFVAVEKADLTLYYVEKLAVLPGYRHKGYGKKLMESAIDYIKGHGGKKVSIGIINKHTILKNWYKGMGFAEIALREYDHLPFTVCFMEKHVR